MRLVSKSEYLCMSAQSDRFSLHVRHFSELLIQLRAELGNDLDLVLILAVIAERHYAKATDPDENTPSAQDEKVISGINALSIALYTDNPRETVRRKVGLLVEKGWVDCDARGNLSPTEQAKGDLAKGTAVTWKYLGAIAD